ncbi:unnamed protein product [Amoebophrya sp. A120]|nr:unnamed protein product [Amoebophrya sp. A120]|eukprot:GSA120T00020877001.1
MGKPVMKNLVKKQGAASKADSAAEKKKAVENKTVTPIAAASEETTEKKATSEQAKNIKGMKKSMKNKQPLKKEKEHPAGENQKVKIQAPPPLAKVDAAVAQDENSEEQSVDEEENNDEDDESVSDEEDKIAIQSALQKHPNSKSDLKNRVHKTSTKEERNARGVLYIGHLPMGFFEPQLKIFFSQFGEICRLKLSRSKQTGRPKGYAFIEFELKEVAEIVASTMNNYLLYGRKLEVALVDAEKIKMIGRGFWKNWKQNIVPVARTNQKKQKEQHKVKKTEDGKKTILSTRQQRRAKTKLWKMEQLKNCGLENTNEATLKKNVEVLSKASVVAQKVSELNPKGEFEPKKEEKIEVVPQEKAVEKDVEKTMKTTTASSEDKNKATGGSGAKKVVGSKKKVMKKKSA